MNNPLNRSTLHLSQMGINKDAKDNSPYTHPNTNTNTIECLAYVN